MTVPFSLLLTQIHASSPPAYHLCEAQQSTTLQFCRFIPITFPVSSIRVGSVAATAVNFAAFAFSGKAQPQHGVHLVIQNMQHGTFAREFRQKAHSRRAKQRWHYADNAIRLPATLRHQRKETADGKTAEMQQAFQGARLFWHVQRAAPHRGGPLFPFVAPGGIVLAHLPLRVVRRCGNNPHLMTLCCQPFHHLSGVFADAG